MNTKEKLIEIIEEGVERYPDDSLCVDTEETVNKLLTLLTSEVERKGEKVEQVIAELIQTHDCSNDTACKFEDRLVKAQTKIGKIFRQRKALSDIGGKGK